MRIAEINCKYGLRKKASQGIVDNNSNAMAEVYIRSVELLEEIDNELR